MLLLIGYEWFAECGESQLIAYVWFAERKVLLLIDGETPTEREVLLLIRYETLADYQACLVLAIDSSYFLPIRASQPEKLVFPAIILLFFS